MLKKRVAILTTILVLLFGLLYFGYTYNLHKPASDSNETINFQIEQNESINSIVDNLKKEGLIKNKLIFKLYLKLSSKSTKIQAGDFLISRNVNMIELADVLSKAENFDVLKVTIVEGLRYKQIADVLSDAFIKKGSKNFSKEEFINIAEEPDNIEFGDEITNFLNKYKPKGKSLEGFLYPDTYEFETDTDAKFVIETLIKNFIAKTKSLNFTDNFYDKLILASIVEKESFTDDEKKLIASVFINRLNINMPLQSDATVNYATGKDDPRPTYVDLKIDSKYNTYKYTGLPPSPICNPRLESINAAINPAKTEYYYFIHEQVGSGKVHFAKTYSEHLKNIKKYLN